VEKFKRIAFDDKEKYYQMGRETYKIIYAYDFDISRDRQVKIRLLLFFIYEKIGKGRYLSKEAQKIWESDYSDYARFARGVNEKQIQFAKNLECAMQKIAISPGELDEQLELEHGTTNLYLSSVVRPPVEDVKRYATRLKVSPDDLWGNK
jgi:hypothetical protein